MLQKKDVNKKDIRRIRKIFDSSNYSLRILTKIYSGYRPSQIAKQLGFSVQNVSYYTSNLVDLELIEKVGDRRGGLIGRSLKEDYSY